MRILIIQACDRADRDVTQVYLLTCDVGQPEAFSCQTVIRVEVDPNVVLGGQVGGWQRGATDPQTIQAPVAADGDPV